MVEIIAFFWLAIQLPLGCLIGRRLKDMAPVNLDSKYSSQEDAKQPEYVEVWCFENPAGVPQVRGHLILVEID